jgi:hypothetical protein
MRLRIGARVHEGGNAESAPTRHSLCKVALAHDPAGRVGLDYGVYGVPETYVIDKRGIIRYKQIGRLKPEAAAKKNPATSPETERRVLRSSTQEEARNGDAESRYGRGGSKRHAKGSGGGAPRITHSEGHPAGKVEQHEDRDEYKSFAA